MANVEFDAAGASLVSGNSLAWLTRCRRTPARYSPGYAAGTILAWQAMVRHVAAVARLHGFILNDRCLGPVLLWPTNMTMQLEVMAARQSLDARSHLHVACGGPFGRSCLTISLPSRGDAEGPASGVRQRACRLLPIGAVAPRVSARQSCQALRLQRKVGWISMGQKGGSGRFCLE